MLEANFDPSKHRIGSRREKILRAIEMYQIAQDRFISRLKRRIGLIDAVAWQQKEFDLGKTIAALRGPALEVAGPTLQGFSMLPRDKLLQAGKEYLVSNVHDGLYELLSGDPMRTAKIADVDVVADARSLPFEDGALGIVLASCLPRDIRTQAIQEAARVLELGGLLIWQGTFREDIPMANDHGFQLVAYEWEMPARVLRHIHEVSADALSLAAVVFDAAMREGLVTNAGMGAEENAHLYAPRHCIFRKSKPD